MADVNKLIETLLEESLQNFRAGNTNLNEEESFELMEHLMMLNKGVTPVSKAYAMEKILHINKNKFDYLMKKGIIPPPKKRYGFKEDSWIKKDFDAAIKYLNEERNS